MVIMFCFWATATTLFGVFCAPRYDEFIFIDGKLRFEEVCFDNKWEVSGEDSTGATYHYTAKDVDLVLKLDKHGLNVKYINTLKYDRYRNDSIIVKKTGQSICLKPRTMTY